MNTKIEIKDYDNKNLDDVKNKDKDMTCDLENSQNDASKSDVKDDDKKFISDDK